MRCPRCRHESPETARFCGECGASLTARSSLEGERKQVTVLFADMVDSMRLAERVDAEEWHRVLDRFLRILEEGVDRFEVAYAAQFSDQRRRLHAAAAAALEKLRADRLGECAALIAHHWEASGMHYEAARWRRRAALKVSRIMVRGRRRPPAS